MKLTIEGLADIDPTRVTLPHGTEVMTRVDRVHQDSVIRQGAVGRVRTLDGQRVTVDLVGIGSVNYDRSEIIPRKSGQLDFAVRREAAWQSLRGTLVLETVVGSRAWGLADEASDTDKRGLFVLPFPWTTALVDPPLDLVSADGSSHYWEVGKAFQQALRADPNTLEMLFVTSAKANDLMGEWVLAVRDAFISTEIYGTFGRYALSQLRRLRQNLALAEHRRLLMDWLVADSELTLDAAAQRLAIAADISGHSSADQALRAKDYIKQLYSSLYDQGLLAQRTYASLRDFAASQPDFELPRELRPKNAYNLLRLLATATAWLRTGVPDFELRGELKNELLAIKHQQVELATVIERAEALAEDLERARTHSPLPRRPDVAKVDQLLRRIRTEAAQRWFDRTNNGWGQNAPPLPLASWGK